MESLSILSIEADQSLNITITVDRRNSTSDLQAQNLGIQPDSKSTFYSKLFAILVMTATLKFILKKFVWKTNVAALQREVHQ